MSGDPTRVELEFDPRVRRIEGTARHGMTPFSVPLISQVDENLWVGGCIGGLQLPEPIVHLVSLYPWEAYRSHAEIRSVLSIVMYDAAGEIDAPLVERIARWVNECRMDGPTLVHCQAGLNRSNLIAATALTRGGLEPEAAIALLREKRSPAVLCNRDFESFVLSLDSRGAVPEDVQATRGTEGS